MLSEEELTQICRKYAIPCPFCETENEYHRLKRDMARAAKMEGDGHPLTYKWKTPGFDSVDPLQFFMGACGSCGFTGELDDADYRRAGKAPDLFRRDFGEAAIQAYNAAGFDGVMRPDHVPVLAGESGEAGYTMLGRLFAVGYMRGLIEAAGKPG